jgi:hypothetical protein
VKIAFLWFMTPCSLVLRHLNFGKCTAWIRILNTWVILDDDKRQHDHKDVVFAVMAFTSLQPSPYTLLPLLLHAAPLTLKGICPWVCLKPLLADSSSYWMHNNTWATSGSELLCSNWSLIVFRDPFTINLKAFWLWYYPKLRARSNSGLLSAIFLSRNVTS